MSPAAKRQLQEIIANLISATVEAHLMRTTHGARSIGYAIATKARDMYCEDIVRFVDLQMTRAAKRAKA